MSLSERLLLPCAALGLSCQGFTPSADLTASRTAASAACDVLRVVDAHIHLDDYETVDGLKRVYDLDRLTKHLSGDPSIIVDEAYLIYSKASSLSQIAARVPGTQLRGWFWLRYKRGSKPLEVDAQSWATLQQELNNPALMGVKIHPYRDNFALDVDQLEPLLRFVQSHKLAILFHTDDRKETEGLTQPTTYEPIIQRYPDITFVIGHAGAYGPARVTGNSVQAKSYWNRVKPLVQGALDIAARYPNAYVETSYLGIDKATIIKEAIDLDPMGPLKERILIGTDFPLGPPPSIMSQIESLQKVGLAPEVITAIASNRLSKR